MALGFGAILFLLSASMRRHVWSGSWLSVLFGIVNRILARHWYRKTVLPWSEERRALKAQIDTLRAEPPCL